MIPQYGLLLFDSKAGKRAHEKYLDIEVFWKAKSYSKTAHDVHCHLMHLVHKC